MACKDCKKKNEFKEEIVKSGNLVSKKIVVFAIVWTLIGFYGLYHLINKLL